jgi:hypothetical protein
MDSPLGSSQKGALAVVLVAGSYATCRDLIVYMNGTIASLKASMIVKVVVDIYCLIVMMYLTISQIYAQYP